MARAGLLKRLDAAFGPALCALAARPQRAPETRTLRDFPGGRVLVVRPGGIGDAVLLLPALAALRRAAPASPVDVLCEARNAPLFALSGLADRILPYDAHPLRTVRTLRRTRYAAALDTEQFHPSSALFCALSRAPLRIGFNVAPARFGVYTRIVPYDLSGPESAQFARLFAAALDLPAGDASPPFERSSFEQITIPLPTTYAALHVGGSAPCKRWRSERFAALAAALAERHALPCVLLGAREDLPAARSILSLFPSHASASSPSSPVVAPVNLVGRLDLARTAAVCARASLLVGPDSGLAHLAAAVGTPVVALFGPSDPAKWGPPPDRGTALRHPLPCSPCSMFGYTKPCRSFACMDAISVEEVLAAAEKWIK